VADQTYCMFDLSQNRSNETDEKMLIIEGRLLKK
jgi:hypothetical protein